MGWDECAWLRNNSLTTNWGAAVTLRLAARLAERFGLAEPVERWRRIADRMFLPFDEAGQRWLEFEGYDGGPIDQADTVLAIYPYEMPMSPAVKANTVDYYRARYRPDKIMMCSAMDGVVDCELGRRESAWASLIDLVPHFRRPFLLVSEKTVNETLSFATGIGGFLQLVVMGFGGIRIHDDGLQVTPLLPEPIGTMVLRGIHYGGTSFDLEIGRGDRAVATNFSGPDNFRLYDREGADVPRR